MEQQFQQRPYGGPVEMTRQQPSQHSDNDRSSGELRALDCNLTSLCDHIQLEGFNNGSFSDIVVHAMGSTYHLHRLILSRSSYFRYSFNSSLSGVDFLLIAELGFHAILLFSSDHMQWLLGLFFPAGILVVFMQFSLSC